MEVKNRARKLVLIKLVLRSNEKTNESPVSGSMEARRTEKSQKCKLAVKESYFNVVKKRSIQSEFKVKKKRREGPSETVGQTNCKGHRKTVKRIKRERITLDSQGMTRPIVRSNLWLLFNALTVIYWITVNLCNGQSKMHNGNENLWEFCLRRLRVYTETKDGPYKYNCDRIVMCR